MLSHISGVQASSASGQSPFWLALQKHIQNYRTAHSLLLMSRSNKVCLKSCLIRCNKRWYSLCARLVIKLELDSLFGKGWACEGHSLLTVRNSSRARAILC